MPFVHLRTSMTILFLCVYTPALMRVPHKRGDYGNQAVGQLDDSARIREMAEQYIQALEKGDVTVLVSFWSRNSAQLPEFQRDLQKFYARANRGQFLNLRVDNVVVTGDACSVEIRASLDSTYSRNPYRPWRELGSVITVRLVKENVSWVVSQQRSAFDEFADRIIRETVPEKLDPLLESEPDLTRTELANVLIRRASVAFSVRDYKTAWKNLDFGYAIAKRIGDREDIARAWTSKGVVYPYLGEGTVQERIAKAMSYETDALRQAKDMGIVDCMVAARRNQADLLQQMGKTDEALAAYQDSVSIGENSKEVSDGLDSELVPSLVNLGVLYRRRAEYDSALEAYKRALRIADRLADDRYVASLQNNIGEILRIRRQFSEAMAHYAEGLNHAVGVENNDVRAALYNNVGIVHMGRGDYGLALKAYEDSLKIKRSMIGSVTNSDIRRNLLRSVNITKTNIASVYMYQGLPNLAEKEFVEIIRTLDEARDQKLITDNDWKNGCRTVVYDLLGALGEECREEKDKCAEAERMVERVIQLAQGDDSGLVTTYHNVGELYLEMGRLAEAWEYLEKSFELGSKIGDKEDLPSNLNSMSVVKYSSGDYQEALRLAKEAVKASQSSEAIDDLAKALTSEGKAERQLNRNADAIVSLEGAIDMTRKEQLLVAGGEEEEARFLASKMSPYLEMVELLVDEGNVRDAFRYAEAAKARTLLSVLLNGRSNIERVLTSEESARRTILSNEEAVLNSRKRDAEQRKPPDEETIRKTTLELATVRADRQSYDIELYAKHWRAQFRGDKTSEITAAEAASLLPDISTAALEYVVTENKTYLFVLRKSVQNRRPNGAELNRNTESHTNEPLVVHSIDVRRAELERLITDFRLRIEERGDCYQQAQELYRLLVKPAEPDLAETVAIQIVPDSVLWNLPFQALMPSADSYMIDRYAISYEPSLTVGREMKKEASTRRPPRDSGHVLLAMGDPSLGGSEGSSSLSTVMSAPLQQIPEARDQVRDIREIYGASSGRVYIGSEAKEEVFKEEAGNYEVIHLAAHGLLDDRSPMYSSIVLAKSGPGQSEDGLLEAWEIMDMSLRARLVVLAACQTAQGRVSTGEGIIGLSWAFLVSGCPTMVVSQWMVDSKSSAGLMVAFHSHLKGSEKAGADRPSVALKKAAVGLLEDKKHPEYAHPYYWAPFVVLGYDQ